MGCIVSKSDASEEEQKANKKIESALRKEKKDLQFVIKLLLLGAGESGKSTFAKQMKILFLEGYTKQELSFYKDIIHSNIIVGMRTIIQEVEKRNWKFDADSKVRCLFIARNDTNTLPFISAICRAPPYRGPPARPGH